MVTKKTILSILEPIGKLSNLGIFLVKLPNHELLYVNACLLKLFDISHKTFGQQLSFYLNHIIGEDLQHLGLAYQTLLKEEKAEHIEFRIKSHDKSIKYISCNCYLLEEKYIIGLLNDITEAKEHEDYIINYGAKKNTLLDMVTHNLSAPLAISKNIIDSLSSSIENGNITFIKEHINLIKENTSQCIDLVNEFLEEEHLVSQDIATKNNRFDVIEKLENILERFRKSYPDYTFHFETHGDAFFITNDDVKFMQIMNNLLSNAVKFSPSGSKIRMSVNDNIQNITITVRDFGIGIPDELQPLLFQKQSLASRTGLNGEKSIGMGLYIVKKLVALMRGELAYNSKVNEGTTFIIKVPKEKDLGNEGANSTTAYLAS